MRDKKEEFKVCDRCGSLYIRLCIHCEKLGIEERTWELLERFGLTEEKLVEALAKSVKDGNFPALNLAITMRDMKPADRHVVAMDEGKKIKDVKERLGLILNRLSKRGR